MSNSESFIEEVSEEVRRDRLYGLLRRWGWVGVLAIIVIVGGAAWSEWSKARDAASAQAFGDAVLSAVRGDDMETRRAALDAVTPTDGDQGAILGLLQGTALLNGEDPDPDAARAAFLAVADAPEVPTTYRHVALLKVILAGGTEDASRDGAILEELAAPGAPFRTLAVEQQALMAVDAGDTGTAVTLLRALLDDAETTQGLRQRAQQLMVALGAEIEPV